MSADLMEQIPYPALGDLTAWLNSEKVPYAVIGGLSLSILAQPRPTLDIDLVVWLEPDNWERLLKSAGRFGIVSRIEQPMEFARERRILLLRHEPTGIGVDISFGALPFEWEMIERSKIFKLGNTEVRILTPEDLIIMKLIAHRDKDLRDIDNLLSVYPDLDFERIKYWVHQFAIVLETPELDTELLQLIKSHRLQQS
jgi:hypothetical protein